MKKRMKKRGVSEMVAYVLLISIALGLAVGVFAWLNIVAKGFTAPKDCKEGTSIMLDSYKCCDNSLYLKIKNNGRFEINGVIVSVGNDSAKTPILYLMPKTGVLKGHYDFTSLSGQGLKPGNLTYAIFENKLDAAGIKYSSLYGPNVTIIQIQPFIREKTKIVCQGAVFKELIECSINSISPCINT